MNYLQSMWEQLPGIQFMDILDIAIVAFLIYRLLPIFRTTGTARIAWVVVGVIVISWVTELLELYTLHFILSQVLAVGLIAIVAAAVVVVILAIILFGGRSAKAATKKCVKAFFTGNEKSMARLYHRKYLNELLDIADLDKDELDELFNLDYYMDEFEDEYGDDWEYSYEIEEIDDVSSKELKEIVKSAKKEYDIKVTAAKEAEVEVKIKGEEGKDKLTFYVHLIKSGGSWYVATSYPTWW